jgi:pimeloyl-ACP methyl ester carboxylesterase
VTLVRTGRKRIHPYARPDKMASMSHGPQMISLDLPDGRMLQVIVSGPPDGVPLVWHHGTPGCAWQLRYRQNEAHARGLRYVTYTRAGAAGSTRRPGRSVGDIAEDVAAILDHLDADRCLVGGNSGGGPHALATGALLPDRVAAVLCVCGIKPYVGEPDFLDGMGEANVEEFELALQGEEALRPFVMKDRAGIIDSDPEGIIETLATLLPEVDRGVLRGEAGLDIIRGLKGGVVEVDGWIDDDLAFIQDWGIDPRELAVPTHVWQGSADLMVPFHHAEWLASNIPGVVPHLLDGEGHFSVLVGRFGAMVDELLPHLNQKQGA